MTITDTGKTIAGKPVLTVPAKSVINMESGFGHKLLCDKLTFTAASASHYSCTYYYVEDLMTKNPHCMEAQKLNPDRKFADVVIRHAGAADAVKNFLTGKGGVPKYLDPNDK